MSRPALAAAVALGALAGCSPPYTWRDHVREAVIHCESGNSSSCSSLLYELRNQDAAAAREVGLLSAYVEERNCRLRSPFNECPQASGPRWEWFTAEQWRAELEVHRRSCDSGSVDACRMVGQSLWLGWGVVEDRDVARGYFSRACEAIKATNPRHEVCELATSPHRAEKYPPAEWRHGSDSARHAEVERLAAAGQDLAAFKIARSLVSESLAAGHKNLRTVEMRPTLRPVVDRLLTRLVEPEIAAGREFYAVRLAQVLVAPLGDDPDMGARLTSIRERASKVHLGEAERSESHAYRGLLHRQLARRALGESVAPSDAERALLTLPLAVDLPAGCEWLAPHVRKLLPDAERAVGRVAVSGTCAHGERQWTAKETYEYVARPSEWVPGGPVYGKATVLNTSRCQSHQVQAVCGFQELRDVQTGVTEGHWTKEIRREGVRATTFRVQEARVEGWAELHGAARRRANVSEVREEKAFNTPHGTQALTSTTLADADAAVANGVRGILVAMSSELRTRRAAEALEEGRKSQAAKDEDAADDAWIRALAFGSKDVELAQWAHRRYGLTLDEARQVLFAEALPDVTLP